MADRAAQPRVPAQVDPADLVGLASALIRIPSFKTEETPVARFLAPFFRERDYRVELQEVEPGRLQAIATLPGTGGGASLMLNGHTDINALMRRWKRDPWTPSLEGDRLYGHGVPPDAEPERAVLYTNCTVSKRTFPNGYATAYLV